MSSLNVGLVEKTHNFIKGKDEDVRIEGIVDAPAGSRVRFYVEPEGDDEEGFAMKSYDTDVGENGKVGLDICARFNNLPLPKEISATLSATVITPDGINRPLGSTTVTLAVQLPEMTNKSGSGETGFQLDSTTSTIVKKELKEKWDSDKDFHEINKTIKDFEKRVERSKHAVSTAEAKEAGLMEQSEKMEKEIEFLQCDAEAQEENIQKQKEELKGKLEKLSSLRRLHQSTYKKLLSSKKTCDKKRDQLILHAEECSRYVLSLMARKAPTSNDSDAE